jgi:dsDNA-specific endonuclease/ATPase MutS2
MSELRTILRLADENSLILGDELCSGTENTSAISIFVAGIQRLHSIQSSFIFATHLHEIVDYIANFTQNWLEDNISDDLYEEIKNTSDKFKDVEKFEDGVIKLFEKYFETRQSIFEEQLEKIKLNVEN